MIVVDDASRDGTAEAVAEAFPEVRLLRNPRREGAAAAKNQGAARARGRYLWFLDSDTRVVLEGCLDRMIEALETRPDIGAIGGEAILLRDGSLQIRAKRNLPNGETATEPVEEAGLDLVPCDYLPTCNLFMRRADFLSLGGFDPAYGIYVEDKELCCRLRERGLLVVIDRRTWVLHTIALEGRRGDLYLSNRNRIRFVLKHGAPGDVARLPLRDLAFVFSRPMRGALRRGDPNVVKHLSPGLRALYGRRVGAPLRFLAVGVAYAAALAGAYLWNLAALPRTLRLRGREPDHLGLGRAGAPC